MVINYDKWKKIDGASSSEDDGSAAAASSKGKKLKGNAHPFFLPPKAYTKGKARAKLITVPWDPSCEAVRWALDRHGVDYFDERVPWGLHLWVTLGFSDPIPHPQQTRVPIYVDERNDVFKRSPTDIFMSLYAQSFHVSERLFTSSESLSLLTLVETRLAPAVATLYLASILSRPDLIDNHLLCQTGRTLWDFADRLLWPATRIALRRTHNVSPAGVASAWDDVHAVFAALSSVLRGEESAAAATPASSASSSTPAARTTGRRKYLAGDTMTAADIAFASHAALLLLPFDDGSDSAADAAGAKKPAASTVATTTATAPQPIFLAAMPRLRDFDPELATRVRNLRKTDAGMLALRLWRHERADRLAVPVTDSIPSAGTPTPQPWAVRLLAATRGPAADGWWPGWGSDGAAAAAAWRQRAAFALTAAALALACTLLHLFAHVLFAAVRHVAQTGDAREHPGHAGDWRVLGASASLGVVVLVPLAFWASGASKIDWTPALRWIRGGDGGGAPAVAAAAKGKDAKAAAPHAKRQAVEVAFSSSIASAEAGAALLALRARQLWFVAFGKAVPTPRDIAEAESAAKEEKEAKSG